MTYHEEHYQYLKQWYTAAQIDLYCAGDNEKLRYLWEQSQPQDIPISTLINDLPNSTYLVDSPDGFVPVVDSIIKNKVQMYKIGTASGKELICSYDHYVETVDNGWVYAQNLQIGEKLISSTGDDVVSSIIQLPGDVTYDLEVGHENHRYYTNGVSSHNSGKSLFLQNLAVNFAKQGLNVIYISLELSEELCSMRMDSMISEVSTKEIFRNLDTVEIKVKQAGNKSGTMHVKQMPQGSTCNDIKAYLKTYEIETLKRPDVLVVDYLDLLFPNNKRIDPSNLFVKDKFVTEELRGLMVERQMIGQTAAQLNRGAVQEQEHDHSHISGGISKIQTADNVISIYASAAMKERGQYQIQFLKTRSSSGVGSKVTLGFDPNTLRIFDSEEEPQVIAGGNAADAFADLRRKNAAIARKEEKEAPKPDAAKSIKDLSSLTALVRR
jgi:hypothetical protein